MWNSRHRYTDYKDECVETPLEKYKVGDWLKKMHEKVDREKEKIQREKKRAERINERRIRREERMERAIAASREIFWAKIREAQKMYKEKNAEKKEKLREIEKNEEKEKESEKKDELREKEKESEKKEDLREKEIETKDVILDSCLYPNRFLSCNDLIIKKVVDDIPKEESCKKEDEEVLPRTQCSASIELQEKNISKSWNTTTIIPSSKLVCVVRCWNSSSVIQVPKISSWHEGNQVNDRDYSLVIASLCEHEKDGYVSESKCEAGQANHSHELAISSIGMVAYGEFFRLIFDPGDNGAWNSRSNSLEEGENDDNLEWMLLT